jgi:hypothetical protein
MLVGGDFMQKIIQEDEYGHKGIEKALQINKAFIDGNDFRRKFENATTNDRVNKTLYEKAREILHNRSGTRYESMCWIDGDTGKVIVMFDGMGNLPELTGEEHEFKVEYSDKILHKLRGHNNIVVIHNHPNSTAPSAGDFNSAFKNGYNLGFVACHNGRLFKYSSNQEINDSIYDIYWSDYCKVGFDEIEAQIRTIQKIARNSEIYVMEVLKK